MRFAIRNIFKTRLNSTLIQKEPLTKLGKELSQTIKIAGPISVSQFMRNCLVHPVHGYYMNQDVFGHKGDFITSPEISQMFGELMAIWMIQYWQSCNSPPEIDIVELGPGRGTLMSDILMTLQQFPFIFNNIKNVHLIDASPYLRELQQKALGKYNLKIDWYDHFSLFKPNKFTIYVAHEFFDALPIYQFKKTEQGMRELLVDNETEGEYHFRYVLAKGETKNLMLLEKLKPELQEGEICQISPDTWDISIKLCEYIKEFGGCSIIADYGTEKVTTDRLRGIKDHKWAFALSSPGELDLSSDVEFGMFKKAADLTGVSCFGPLKQGDFLERMGIQARVMALLASAKSQSERKDIITAYERLTKPEQMGSAYMFSVLTSKTETPPYAFEQ
ncbi:NADH dehydrogenase [ubiquinone] complex I, assembly factor 7 [Boothiomyces sp. JEL0838]|nr:NADH dehydrogenase [ubiquinone] complex I, assembly factor 7 [Boothiomyces sp. JEL0838]